MCKVAFRQSALPSKTNGAMTVSKVEYWKVVVPCRPDTVNSPGIQDSLQRHDPALASFDLGHKWVVRLHSSTGHAGKRQRP
jgi:hypothetical protein